MKVNDLIKNQSYKLIHGRDLDREIIGFYSGDLLSWVMSHAKEHNAWLTVQTHVNIIAIAVLLNLSCIIIVEDALIDEDTILKAQKENITLIQTHLSAVDVIKNYSGV